MIALLTLTAMASAAASKLTQPQIVFPTACPVLENFELFGTADLTLTVESDGSVGKVVIDNSSGDPLLDDAFRRALGKSRAVPGTVNGNPQPMTIAVKIESRENPNSSVYSMWVTVERGSQPRVAGYNCRFHDPNPYDPLLTKG
jgi:TonB family protein